MRSIDLNADLGETIGGAPTADDEAMFAVVSSANVACGGHAGDAASMRTAVARALRHGVAIGAHPSYLDPAGFGRVPRNPPPEVLEAEVSGQLDALAAAGAHIRYVKPHGALYHAVAADPGQAAAVMAAVVAFASRAGRPVPLLGSGGAIAREAERAGVPFFAEAFLDRGYTAAGGLVPRGAPGALVTDPAAVAARAVRLVREGVVEAQDGAIVEVDAASLCLHGDNPEAVALAVAVRAALEEAGAEVRAPW